MKCSCNQTFTLTTSRGVNKLFTTFVKISTNQACAVQSALTSVRSVECGLFA